MLGPINYKALNLTVSLVSDKLFFLNLVIGLFLLNFH